MTQKVKNLIVCFIAVLLSAGTLALADVGIRLPEGQQFRMRDAFSKLIARTRVQRVRGERICIARTSTLRHDQKNLSVFARDGASTATDRQA